VFEQKACITPKKFEQGEADGLGKGF